MAILDPEKLAKRAVGALISAYKQELAYYSCPRPDGLTNKVFRKKVALQYRYTRALGGGINRFYLHSKHFVLSLDWWKDVEKRFGVVVPASIMKFRSRPPWARPVW